MTETPDAPQEATSAAESADQPQTGWRYPAVPQAVFYEALGLNPDVIAQGDVEVQFLGAVVHVQYPGSIAVPIDRYLAAVQAEADAQEERALARMEHLDNARDMVITKPAPQILRPEGVASTATVGEVGG